MDPVQSAADPRIRKELAFTKEDYLARLDKLREELERSNLDVLLVFDPVNHNYLTGYQSQELTPYRCLEVPRRGEPTMVTSNFERPGVELTSIVEDIVEYHWASLDYFHLTRETLGRILGTHSTQRVGIEKDTATLTPTRYEQLVNNLHGFEVTDASTMVDRLRTRKSRGELKFLREAARVSSLGMAAAIGSVEEGQTDNAVAAVAYETMTREGSEYVCYAPFVTTGRRSGIPHTTYRRRKMEGGDVVFIELGACIERYSGPLMRTVHLGRSVEPAVRHNAGALLDVLNDTIDNISPGLSCDEVARVVRKRASRLVGNRVISPSLIDGNFGYSIGLGFPPTWGERSPGIAVGDKTILEPGMVFHLNETFREVGRYGLSFSETVAVSANGCEVLTKCEREFISV